MPKNRTIYNALALYAGQVNATGMQTGLGDVLQLSRVQSFDEDFTRNFTDVNQFGNLATIDRVEVEAPEVTANFSYYLTNGFNDHAIGLAVAPIFYPSIGIISCISGLLSRQTDEKNYYLLIADEGSDSVGFNSNNSGVLGIGNAYLTSYSINAAVGDIATAEIEVQGLNLAVYKNRTNTSGYLLPSINPAIGTKIENNYFALPPSVSASGIPSALLPGDIIMSIPTNSVLGFENTDLKIQDFNLSFDLNRTPLQKIGNRFSFSREIDFPVTATLELTAEAGDLRSGNLVDLLCEETTQDFTIEMKEPGCGQNKTTALLFIFRGAKLTSQSFTSTIGDNASMTASYEVQLGGIQDKTKGIFISGSYYEDCPTVGNRPHFLIGGYSITNNGGKYYTKISNTWFFNNSAFPGSVLRTGTFFATGDIRQTIGPTTTDPRITTFWNGYTAGLVTGWSTNTEYLEFSPGSFISIMRTGTATQFPLDWYSTSINPNLFSIQDKLSLGVNSSVFNTFTLVHTSGFNLNNNSWRVTGSLSSMNGLTNDSLIGYLPPNDKYLFFKSNFAPVGGNIFLSVSGSTSGYYNIAPSLDGSCPNVSNFVVTY